MNSFETGGFLNSTLKSGSYSTLERKYTMLKFNKHLIKSISNQVVSNLTFVLYQKDLSLNHDFSIDFFISKNNNKKINFKLWIVATAIKWGFTRVLPSALLFMTKTLP